jgi:ADP-heptose:LPS heptosyltransferase
MDAIFFLRSYGDFIVAVNAVRNDDQEEGKTMYVSQHLRALYNALPTGYRPRVQFIDLGIRHNILAGFTNRYLFTTAAVKELFTWRRVVKALPVNVSAIFLEQWRRKWLASLFAGTPLRAIHSRGNIYHSYATFFNSTPADFSFQQPGAGSSILVFTDSRKRSKALPDTVVKMIGAFCHHRYNVTFANFGAAAKRSQDDRSLSYRSYNNFEELTGLVRSADFIISSDSLPVHLAQLFEKPHWVIYHGPVNQEWLTPHALQHGHYCVFSDMEKLKSFLTGGQ